jgi:hypothetical protein
MRRCTLTRQGHEGHWYNTDTVSDGWLDGSGCSWVKGSRDTGAKCDLQFQIQVWRSTVVCTHVYVHIDVLDASRGDARLGHCGGIW